MKRILIADDNKNIISILSDYANKEGYEVFTAFDGEETLDVFDNRKIDLILLDVMMPKLDGFDVCKIIRETSSVPIIMITARGEDYDKIMGLDIGADDYIVKPFSPSEVMARVRAILRRVNDDKNEIIQYDNLKIDLEKYVVEIDGKQVNLTKKEIEILWLLATNKGKVFTRDNLLDSVWGYDYYGDSRTVDSHIKRLRAKLNEFSNDKWQIKTIWGVGYQFEVEKNET
ncbi:response regulator transcription factor [Breznakia pachnodae]|uniref:DNA-binding response OmpR family regulator n=1 Tax=Breznakia pachnodae TaxID=265178 RepID=A0ABU0E8Q3_9FIRM|nr:response regulator transcription factor [Breznakia pachnodae]MDQ0363195.1 DNA-binding response OmpR family regulator [Breznakia pachnodae]